MVHSPRQRCLFELRGERNQEIQKEIQDTNFYKITMKYLFAMEAIKY